jgi:hypothetical protein
MDSGGRYRAERIWQAVSGGYLSNVIYITKFAGFKMRYFSAKNLKKQESSKSSGRD